MNNCGQKAPGSRAKGEVTRDYGPAATGEGAGTSFAHMSDEEIKLASMSGHADPLAHKIQGKDTDPHVARARERFIQEQDSKLQGPKSGRVQSITSNKSNTHKTKSNKLALGEKVYHKKHKIECRIIASVDDESYRVQPKKGNPFTAHISNLVKL